MDKEKSSAETAKVFRRAPKMFVIKGRQTEYVSVPIHSLYAEVKKFARIKDRSPLFLQLPLDNLPNRFIKRAADILISILVIVLVLSWLIPMIALLIKLDAKGPVFFLQKRIKRNDEVFTCIKFRSMIENDETENMQSSAEEERITKLGWFLRNTHIDKLPQFFNILIGDMSFIGPQPHLVSDNNKYEELIGYYYFRHKVKPGITGLSQIMSYVGETKHIQAIRDSVQLDIFYVRRWSFVLDLRIAWHSFLRFARI